MNTRPKSYKKIALLIAGSLGILFIGAFLANNFAGSGSKSNACQDILRETILSVSGVKSVTVDCNLQFGGGWQRAEVHMNTSDVSEAQVIATNVIKAYASQKSVDDAWGTPQVYKLNDGSTLTTLSEFNGAPSVREAREHFNIYP